jgi:CRISPR/Cas system CSM-associated protein Csm2 small subunit
VDGVKGKFTETNAPIIYTLFVSVAKNIIHCVKVSNVNPNLIKKFFDKFINEETEKLQMKGGAKNIYANIVSKVPVITSEAYRTYKISGLTKVIELNMDINQLTPKNKNVTGIDKKSQLKNI